MDVALFSRMLADPLFPDLRKLRYKYPQDFEAFLAALRTLYYRELPLRAFDGSPLVYLENYAGVDIRTVKLLLRRQTERYGVSAAEEEILTSSAIESIDFRRESIRSILKGFAPRDEAENRILGQKRGLDYIADRTHAITEENLHRLYQMTVGDFLGEEARLPEGAFYRNDEVFVVGDRVEHAGLAHGKLPDYMGELMAFVQTEDGMDELLKAAVLHYYIAYLHPYFDGNGRTARLLHLWYLLQRGYETTLFVPFSALIVKSRSAYYKAFTTVEENRRLSGVLDVTPFLNYMADMVYNRMPQSVVGADVLALYRQAVEAGAVTQKEAALWRFVLSQYAGEAFSTKRLEREFGAAAYATVRGFVRKFCDLGLLTAERYGNRTRYRVAPDGRLG